PPTTSTLFPYTTLFRSVHSIVGPRVRPPSFKQAKKKFSKSEVTMIVLDSRVHHFAKRFISMIVLLSAAPIALWAQGQVPGPTTRSEEHTSELQSPCNLV